MTSELFSRAKHGDMDARNELVEKNMGLVRKISNKYRSYVDMDTLVQEGSIGLMKAIEKFDEGKGFAFSTYAYYAIDGEIKRFIRDKREDRPFRIRRGDHSLYRQICATYTELEAKFNRTPTHNEIATSIGIECSEIQELLSAVNGNLSLYDNKLSDDGGNDIYVIDGIENKDCISEDSILDSLVLENALSNLDDRLKKIIKLRYVDDLTQTEVAKEIGVTQVQVSRLEKKALNQLRQSMESMKKII